MKESLHVTRLRAYLAYGDYSGEKALWPYEEEPDPPQPDTDIAALLDERDALMLAPTGKLYCEMVRRTVEAEDDRERLIGLLRETQWLWVDPDDFERGKYCPFCAEDDEAGHAPNCRIRAAIEGRE